MLKRSPIIAIFIAVVIFMLVYYFIQIPERPFTVVQMIVLYIISYAVSLGIALLFDPKSAETNKNYLKINFYKEN